MEDGNSIDEIERRTVLIEAQVLCVMCVHRTKSVYVNTLETVCKTNLIFMFISSITLWPFLYLYKMWTFCIYTHFYVSFSYFFSAGLGDTRRGD